MRHSLPLTLTLLVSGCRDTTPKFELRSLPSGRVIKMIGIEMHTYSEDTPVLVLKYQSDLLPGNERLIDREIDEVWDSFRIETERAKLNDAAIEVFTRPEGSWFASKSTSYTYWFKRLPNGEWGHAR
jgi:hypothetical protein